MLSPFFKFLISGTGAVLSIKTSGDIRIEGQVEEREALDDNSFRREITPD